MARLQKLAVAVCILQALITIGVPLMQFFLVFDRSIGHMHILIVTGASALIASALGLSSALSRGPVLPALHVVAAILLAALMGSFNTQTYLDLNARCNIAQAAIIGCDTCTCAATSSCSEQLLKAAACSNCRALGTDLCIRVRWQALLLPYTGLIEAVLLALPGFISLLLLLQHSSGSASVMDFGGKGGSEVKVMVNAWPGHSASEPEDWPSTNPVAAVPAQRANSSKHATAPEHQWQHGPEGGNMVTELSNSGHMTASGLNHSLESEQGPAEAKKKAPGLKKKLKSSISAARADAALG